MEYNYFIPSPVDAEAIRMLVCNNILFSPTLEGINTDDAEVNSVAGKNVSVCFSSNLSGSSVIALNNAISSYVYSPSSGSYASVGVGFSTKIEESATLLVSDDTAFPIFSKIGLQVLGELVIDGIIIEV